MPTAYRMGTLTLQVKSNVPTTSAWLATWLPPCSPLITCTALSSPLLTGISSVRLTETAPATLELLTCWKFITQPIPSHCCLHSWSPQKTAAQVETVVSAHLKFFLITTTAIPHCGNTLTGQRLAPAAAAESLAMTEKGI